MAGNPGRVCESGKGERSLLPEAVFISGGLQAGGWPFLGFISPGV